jgi:hypothetical protein
LWHISTPGPVIEKKIANFQIFIYLFVLENKEKLSTSPFFLGVPNFAQILPLFGGGIWQISLKTQNYFAIF